MKGSEREEKRVSGFTLVEILVLIAVLGIIGAIAVPNFIGLTPRMRIKSAARNIVSDMQMAKTKALRDGLTWTIQFDTSNNQYSVLDGSGSTFKTVNLSDYSGITLGNDYGERPDEPNPGSTDGVTFADDKIPFNSDGTSVSGTVYIKNSDSDTFAVGCLSAAGRVKTWYNYGSGWED